jgi:hypothetical protein
MHCCFKSAKTKILNNLMNLVKVFLLLPTDSKPPIRKQPATLPLFFGGGKRDRTADLLHAMQALSQLSYTPLQNRNEIV